MGLLEIIRHHQPDLYKVESMRDLPLLKEICKKMSKKKRSYILDWVENAHAITISFYDRIGISHSCVFCGFTGPELIILYGSRYMPVPVERVFHLSNRIAQLPPP